MIADSFECIESKMTVKIIIIARFATVITAENARRPVNMLLDEAYT